MKPRRFVTFILLTAFFAVSSWAKITPSIDLKTYYAGIDGLKGSALRTKLETIISTNYTSVSYSNIGLILKYADTENADGTTLIDIYTPCTFTLTSSSDDITWCGSCSGKTNVGKGLNREHTVPQSWFNKESPMVSDAFHIYAVDAASNGHRSDYYYGECTSGVSYTGTSCNEAGKLGTNTSFTSLYSGTVYEPQDEYKGDIARGYFYMATRYASSCSDWGEMFGSDNNGLTNYTVSLMLKWHRQDPVSEKEKLRNEVIYGNTTYNKGGYKQKNRNPFIDYPELVEYIWGNSSSTAVDLDALTSSYDAETTPTTTITFAQSSVDLTVGGTITNKATANSGGKITYTSSNTSVATVSSTGLITAIGEGTATITATVAANGDYAAAYTTCTVNVGALCTVYWMADGSTYNQNTVIKGGTPSKPTDPDDCSATRVFVGWTAQSSYDSDAKPSDLFTDEVPTVSNTTQYFYAVYATSSGSGGSGTTTFAASDFSGKGTSSTGSSMSVTTDGITLAFSKGYGTTEIRAYAGGEITVSGATITQIVFTTTSASNYPSSRISTSTGTYTGGASTTGTWTGSATSITFSNTSQVRLSSIVVTYGTPSTYSDYSLMCTDACSATITVKANDDNMGTVSVE